MSNVNGMRNRLPTPNSPEPLWDVTKIEAYFNRDLPKEIMLDEVTRITDVRAFVARHLGYLKHQDRKPTFYVYYERLQQLAKLLKPL